MSETQTPAPNAVSNLAKLLCAIPPGRRAALLQSIASFEPDVTFEASFAVGKLRACFADLWEDRFGVAVPVVALRTLLAPPLSINTLLKFTCLGVVDESGPLVEKLQELVDHLYTEVTRSTKQLHLFESTAHPPASFDRSTPAGVGVVSDLHELVDQQHRFPTIYAAPPWRYDNTSSRGAAANHYPTMTVEEICAEPVEKLAEDNSHLHLWTTNAFLLPAMKVMDAWGFSFKSCLVWLKNEIGCGNYWRLAHEYLLLGVRGHLVFRNKALPSWIQTSRTIHSRKPAKVRALIEKASPGPYLELYGREHLPNSDWTVFGDQIKKSML